MTQITLPDEQYEALVALARERGTTPDKLIAAMIERFEQEDQLAFWGEGIVENIQRQMAETETPRRHLTADEFFAELDTSAGQKSSDADV